MKVEDGKKRYHHYCDDLPEDVRFGKVDDKWYFSQSYNKTSGWEIEGVKHCMYCGKDLEQWLNEILYGKVD